MATTASISISSDITDSIPFSVNASMTMYQAGTTLDLEETTGLAQRTFSGNTTQVVLVDVSAENITASGANKVYIRNTGTDKTQHFKITLADTTDDTEEIGRLYGGDWMLIPYKAASGKNLEFTASDTTETTLEYCVFYE